MRLKMKTYDIGGYKSIHQLGLPGAYGEGLRIGPGICQKMATRASGLARLMICGNKSEVIILNEDHGMLGAAHLFNEHFGKFFVYALVIGPIAGAEDGPRVRNVAERPQALV